MRLLLMVKDVEVGFWWYGPAVLIRLLAATGNILSMACTY